MTTRDAGTGGVATETRALLESAVRKLGPERAQQALRAFDDPSPSYWQGCALACAYGARGELETAMDNYVPPDIEEMERWCGDEYETAARLIGLEAKEVAVVASAFDGLLPSPDCGRSPELKQCLRELLEAEAGKVRASRVQAASTADPEQDSRRS